MSSESVDHQLSRLETRQPELEQFPCPRCNSTNTKFCYYNNYNLSQPRHFCKSCRRYWTRGGALRNVPVGGGTRKAHSSKKRPRIATSTSTNTSTTSTTSFVSCSAEKDETGKNQAQTINNPVITSFCPGSGSGAPAAPKLNEAAVPPDFGNSGSWFGGQMGGSDGLYGNYGLSMLEWPPMEHMRVGGSCDFVSESRGENTWQMSGGGDDFSWPEVAIPTPAKALK